MLFKSNKIIGLDIGSSSIKILELDVSGKKTSLASFAIAPTPPNSMIGGEIVDVQAVSQTIKALADQVKTKRKHIATGIWGTAVVVKRVNLPKMEESLLDEQLKWEAEQYIPFDIQEINLEYHVLKTTPENPETMDVLLVAAKKDLILNYLEAIELTGISCSVLDVSSFALANCYLNAYGPTNGESVGIFDIGGGVTNFTVVENEEIVFARDIPVGGSNITSDIQKNMNVSAEEAEVFKLDLSLGRPTPEELKPIIQSTNNAICEELSRSIDFYSTTSSQNKISKIYVTGGASLTFGLKETLAQMSQLPVADLLPFQNIQVDKSVLNPETLLQIAPYSAIAIGLGLRKVGDR